MSEPTAAQRAISDFAPKLVELTDDILFGDIWQCPGLDPRDRSLITVTKKVFRRGCRRMSGTRRLSSTPTDWKKQQ